MKRLLLLVIMVAVATCLPIGCVGDVKTYTDSGQSIDINVNQQFVIALGSNPTTGYSWQESYDESMLTLVEKTYEQGKAAQEGMVGVGGIEYLQFKALKKGQTEVTLIYKRAWEEQTPQDEIKVFTINIK